jgi:hypothetical protein
MLNNLKIRPFFINIIFRSLKYWILIYFPLLLFSFFLSFKEYKYLKKIQYPYGDIINILDSLFISPLIETSVIAVLYITCNNMSFKSKYRNGIFIFTVTLIAFFAHGATVGSVWPTIGFFCQAIFFVRTIITYKCSLLSAMIGTALIHALHNIPYVLKLIYSNI